MQGLDQKMAAGPEYGPLLLLDTAGCDMEEDCEEGSDSRRNEGEAKVALAHAQKLLAMGLTPEDVGIITPYSAQVAIADVIHFVLSRCMWYTCTYCPLSAMDICKAPLLCCWRLDCVHWPTFGRPAWCRTVSCWLERMCLTAERDSACQHAALASSCRHLKSCNL